MGIVATWRAVAEYVGMLSEACQVRGSELGWTAYGELAMPFCFLLGVLWSFGFC